MPDTSPPLVEPFAVDQSRTVERAHNIVADLNQKFSAPRYRESGRTLSINWLTSPELKAWSGPADDGASDVIALSYGTAMALYADAYAFCRIAADHFTLSHYDYLFENFDYGEGRIVLPNGLGFEMASDLMFHLSIAWLYLHEQAHLFREHVALAGGVPVRMATDVGELSVIDELASHSSGKDLRGTDAAISHVVELSADAEATSLVFQFLMFLNGGQVSQGSLWMLICAIACLFQRFFGTRSLASPQEALGTHPDPAFRMRMAVKELRELLMHEKVRPRLPWLADAADFDRVVDHATTTVSMFWTIRLKDQGREKVPDFYAGVHAPDLTPVAYRDALFAAWSQLKGPVERAYRGWGTELPFDPLSSRAFS